MGNTTYELRDIYNNYDVHKLFLLKIESKDLKTTIIALHNSGVVPLNLGKEISQVINRLTDTSFLDQDVMECLNNLFIQGRSNMNIEKNKILAIYNLGILVEPALCLNVSKILKDYSRAVKIIIVWEFEIESFTKLSWPNKQLFVDFGDSPLKILNKIDHEI